MPNAPALTGSPSGLPPIPQQQGMPQQQAGAPQQPQQPPPPLSHEQATAALRHFHALGQELETLLKNPDLGRSDVRSAIIDGTTKLVASRIITPGDAVKQLGEVPDDPKLQRKWVQQHFEQTMMAENAILDHHRQSNPGSQDWAVESQARGSHPDQHIDIMKGVHARYRGGARA